ncbi:MAG: serine protease [Halobacteriovoraceae bacterium]|nr:serine protease [Halobacteriovoraceae bacterium]
MPIKFVRKRVFNIILVLLQFSTITSAHGDELISPELGQIPNVIYGVDNRQDTENYHDRKFRELAKSVAGMVSKNKLVKDFLNPEQHSFFKKTAKRAYRLCEEERFALQNVLPICTGFLVAPDIMVTAGHCITSEEECERFAWVFDYTKGTTKIPNENIYNCKEILGRETKDTYLTLKDYAVIRLTRKVEGRKPLKFRRKGRPNLGTPLVVIGHPIGLPQKIANGAEVKIGHYSGLFTPIRSLIRKRHFIMANVDTFVGNSGSPVFNEDTGEVEGILVEGAEDFEEDPDFLCKRSVKKKDKAFGVEEKIFRINRIDVLKDLPRN